MEKICKKCLRNLKIELFPWRNKTKGEKHYNCCDCHRVYTRQHYKNNKKYYLDKAAKRNKTEYQKARKYIFEYLQTHPCIDCGEYDFVVLEFDHREPKSKRLPVSCLLNRGINALKAEIEKCDVRCANCHRRKTANQLNWYKDLDIDE